MVMEIQYSAHIGSLVCKHCLKYYFNNKGCYQPGFCTIASSEFTSFEGIGNR